jgi:vacuolar-type H+-ATPase subunit H
MGEKKRKSDVLTAVEKIKEVERKARGIIQDAREKTSSKVIEDADEEAKKFKENDLNEARKRAYAKKTAIIQSASREALKIRKESEEDKARMCKKAEVAMSKTVEKVTEKIKHFFEGGKL